MQPISLFTQRNLAIIRTKVFNISIKSIKPFYNSPNYTNVSTKDIKKLKKKLISAFKMLHDLPLTIYITSSGFKAIQLKVK